MRMNRYWALGLFSVAGLNGPAWAALSATSPVPTGTLTFAAPTGNVGPMDSIPLMVTLTLAPDSAPFVLDGLGQVSPSNYGHFADVLPDGFQVSFASISYSFTWGGTFSQNGISGPPYRFDFTNGPGLSGVTLQPGNAVTFEFGSYTPSSGPVTPGTYVGNPLSISLDFTDSTQPDPTAGPGAPNGWRTEFTVAGSCAGCFQRTVVAAVPEPETYAMLLAGLGVMGWAVRRRKRS